MYTATENECLKRISFCICSRMCVFSHLGREQSKMTDRERDQIDADAEVYIKTCVSAIQQLRRQGMSICDHYT